MIAAAAEGYAFPANLDRVPPRDRLAPPTQADLFTEALFGCWDDTRFTAALDAQDATRLA